jgi:pimeloyl-ACP methyl ester carboxylesterase
MRFSSVETWTEVIHGNPQGGEEIQLELLTEGSSYRWNLILTCYSGQLKTKAGNLQIGWLKVPVVHNVDLNVLDKTPYACLRIAMMPATKQPAKRGPILLHTGGPGSDASAVTLAPALSNPQILEEYDFLSISQRFMNQFSGGDDCPFKDNGGEPVKVWPEPLACSNVRKMYKDDPVKLWDKLTGGDTFDQEALDKIMSDDHSSPIESEDVVRRMYRLTTLELNLCFQDKRYEWRASGSSKSVNLLSYGSTSDLAQDIDLLRTAMGSREISIYGISYGTKVGSVYATMFPDKTKQLILDGPMATIPDTEELFNWFGEGVEAVWAGLAGACDNSVMQGGSPETVCPAGPSVTKKLHQLLRGKDKQVARGLSAILTGYIFEFDASVQGAPMLMQCIADLAAGKSDCVSGITSRQTFVGIPATMMALWAVYGGDFSGRMTEDAYIRWYRAAKDRYPLGMARTLQMVGAAAWPALPRPHPPVGDSKVAPLIAGHLFDPRTPYRNVQRMGDAFPSGRVLTTQFYGHGLVPGSFPSDDLEKSVSKCASFLHNYLTTGELPRDFVCTANPPNLGNSFNGKNSINASLADGRKFNNIVGFDTGDDFERLLKKKGKPLGRQLRSRGSRGSKGGREAKGHKKSRGRQHRSRK